MIEEVLNNLEDVERMTIYLGEMGREHQRMGVHKQYLDVMGPIFCQALRPILQAEGLWDNDVRTAWFQFPHPPMKTVLKVTLFYKTINFSFNS